MEDKKTGYDWCLIDKVRLLDLAEWSTGVDSYFEEKITHFEYIRRLLECKIKKNSTPRKTDMYLEYRMYGLVAYQLCGTIHAGIQFGHAVVEYGQLARGIEPIESIYNKYAQKDKTFIILNGGTTNENPERFGTLQQHAKLLRENKVLTAEFREPDLNDTLTAIVFLVDERVFKRDVYPDFVTTTFPDYESDEEGERQYKEWVKKVGGESNVFLRTFLQNFRLA
jgi:hypothetical protein